MPTARSSPQASTAAWWNSAPPASRKPPLRPAAPPAIGPASIPTTLAPASSAAPTAASPEPPSPTTHTSAATEPSSGGGFSHAVGSPQTGNAAAVMARDRRGFSSSCHASQLCDAFGATCSCNRPEHPSMPIEPPPCAWSFPPVDAAGDDGLLALGADLEPATLLTAYRAGIFPMPLTGVREMAWFSPEPRGIIPLVELHVSRSIRRFEVTHDRAFADVIAGCADRRRRGGWITRAVRAAYTRLHALGWAHSVEVWDAGGALAGGLYGVEIGGLFAAESKFHVRTDASKVALVALVRRLRAAGGPRLLDVQWTTPHLAALGASDMPRAEYLERLPAALAEPPAFASPEGRSRVKPGHGCPAPGQTPSG